MGTAIMIRRTAGDVLRFYRRSWWRLATIELLMGLTLAALAYIFLLVGRFAVAQLRSGLTAGGYQNSGAVFVFGLVLVMAFLVACLPLAFGGIAAVIRVTDDQLAGHRPSTLRSLASGVRDGMRMAAGLAVAVLILFALFVFAPAISVVGLLGLVLTPLVRLARRRRPDFAGRWPSIRLLVRALIPFGLAAEWLAQALLFLPEVALKSAGPIASLRRTASIARGRRLFIVLSVLAAVVVSSALDLGISYLGSLGGSDLGTLAQVVSQLIFVAMPIVVLTVVYRLAEVSSDGSALPPSPTAPYAVGRPPRPSRKVTPGVSPAWTRRVAIVMPAVLVLAGLVAAPLSASADTPTTFTVNSAADDTDPATLSGEQANCESGSGTCTLRAALAEAATLSTTGTVSAITIAFSVDATIPVTAATPLAFNNAGGDGGDGSPSQGTLTIDGLGHAVTIDGQNASQDMNLFSNSWDFVVKGLEFKNGNASAGGGLSVGEGTVLVDSDTFDHNVASGGGGLYASGTVVVQNSTFTANSLAAPDGNTVPGGADIFGGGTVRAVNDTFAESSGGSIYNWGGQQHTLSLNNSIIAIDASAAQGGFDCSGGGITGTDDVVVYGDTTCPGIIPSASSGLGPLARVNPDAPPVLSLMASFSAAFGAGGIGAGAAACPSLDERGQARPSSGCDAGAYQFDPATAITLSSSQNPAVFGHSVAFTAQVSPANEPTTITSGTVQFLIDGVDAGAPVAMQSDGTAAFTTDSLTAGSHQITASYTPAAGGTYTASSTASALTEVVQSAGSVVTINSDVQSAALGQTVNFTISVGPSTQAITGTVTLTDVTGGQPGTVVASSVPLQANGTAAVSTSALPVGPRTLLASYSGDANNAPGASAPFVEDIRAASTVGLSSDLATDVYGAPITFSATVPTSAGATPTGSMVFSYGPGGSQSQQVALDGTGTATLTLSRLDVGTDEVSAYYNGDQVYASSNGPTIAVTIAAASTTTTVSANPSGPVAYGVPVTLKAVVRNTAASSTVDPTGTVQFTSGGTTLGTGTLVGNDDGTATASYTTTVGQLPVGADSFSGEYTPDFGSGFMSNFIASDSFTGSVTVVPASTVVSVDSDAETAAIGQQVNITATVGASGGSDAVPQGTVTFTDGAATLGSTTLSGGIATLGIASLGLGAHDIVATFAPGGSFTASSGQFTQTITTAATTTTLSGPTTGVYGQPVTLLVTVSGQGGSSPNGTVTLSDSTLPAGAQTLATIPISAGAGSVTLSSLGVGTRYLVASYAAAGGYLASVGTSDYTVTAASTATTLQAPATSAVGDPVTFTATVDNASSASVAVPNGSVAFFFDGALLGTAPLSAFNGTTGTATFSAVMPQSSAYYPNNQIPITAEFVPADGNFTGSSGAQLLTVLQGETAVSLAVTPGTVGSGVTATATISVTRGQGTPTGTVQFSYNGNLEDVAVVGGQAVLSGILLPVGQHQVTAVYTSSDPNFLAGVPDGSDRAGVQVNIGQAAPGLTLTGSASGPIGFGAADTLTATIPGAGPTPTGSVTFTAVGPQGSTVLGTVSLTAISPLLLSGGSNATFVATNIPVGDQLITASYTGDINYTMAASTSIAQTVVATSTATTVTSTPAPSVVGQQVTYTATVVGSTGATPTGTVAFVLDGVSLGAVTLGANGTASVTSTPHTPGSPRLVATYTPADSRFTGSVGSVTSDVELIPTTIALSADDYTPALGQDVTFTATVTPPPGYATVTSSLPAGTITISDGAGNECVTGVYPGGTAPGEVVGSCTIAWTGTGAPEVTANYTGDSNFAGGTTTPIVFFVGRQAPTISFQPSPDRAWVGGETTTLYWNVAGPSADDAPITITLGSATVCTSTARVGSCNYTFPTGPSGTRSFSLRYGGDSNWTAKNVTLAGPITACVPFVAPTVTPAGTGTVTMVGTPDCDGGTGFLAGESVGFTGTANTGYTLSGWSNGNSGTTATVVASYPGVVTDTAFTALNCVVVSLYAVDPNVPIGDVITSSDPNCGATPWEWTRTSNGEAGNFSPGTALTLTAPTPANVGGAPQTFYQWEGLDAGANPLAATTVLHLVPGTDRRVGAVFGVVCYHHISFPTPNGGTAVLGAPNCTDPSGPGYAAGSTVSVSTHAIGTNYFTGWGQFGPVPVHTISSDSQGSTGTLEITSDNIIVTAGYGGCVQFSVIAAGDAMANGNSPGTASVSPAGNCPSEGAGWYTKGSSVSLTAVPAQGITFGGWSGLPVEGGAYFVTDTTAYMQLNTSGTETATFYNRYHCVPLNLVSKPAGALTITASFESGAGICPAGEYDDSLGAGSNQVVLTATSNAGAHVIGWSGTSGRLDSNHILHPLDFPGLKGSSITVPIYGATTFTAWACEYLDANLTLISPNGTSHTTPLPANTDFIDVAPGADCPFSGSAYSLGQSVFPQANGPSAGYSFVGWSGAITGSSAYPTTPINLDGSATSVPLTATYQVQCHTLTANFDNVAVDPAPNCPDTPASAHEYIGGTAVTLQQTGDGSLVFRGWTGSPDGTDGAYAISQMNSDTAIYADYTSKSIGEKITAVATVVGDALANGTKKLVGVAAAVATGLLIGADPLTAVAGIAVLLGKAVQGIASALGVSSGGLVAFENGIDDISAMMTFLSAVTNCATVWSATSPSSTTTTSSDAGSTPEGALGHTLVKTTQAEQKAAAQAAEKLAQQQAISATSSIMGDAKVVARRLGAAGSIATGIYAVGNSAGGGWGDSASEAWTTGGDAYATCYGQSIPAYFGLPPVPPGQ